MHNAISPVPAHLNKVVITVFRRLKQFISPQRGADRLLDEMADDAIVFSSRLNRFVEVYELQVVQEVASRVESVTAHMTFLAMRPHCETWSRLSHLDRRAGLLLLIVVGDHLSRLAVLPFEETVLRAGVGLFYDNSADGPAALEEAGRLYNLLGKASEAQACGVAVERWWNSPTDSAEAALAREYAGLRELVKTR